MFLKKLGKRGVAMTEYAILLAFVAAVAGSFTSDNGLASSITAAIGKAENAINMAMGNEQNTKNYAYNTKLDSDYIQYQEFMDELINNLYYRLNTDENHALCSVWIKKGEIYGYGVYNDANGKGGGSRTLDTPIKVADLMPKDSPYVIYTKADSHIIYDQSGNVANHLSHKFDDWNNCSRVYVSKANNTDKFETCLTFKQSNETFSGAVDYWKESDYWNSI